MTTTALPPVPARSLRNADIQDLVALLQTQDRQKLDIVVPASSLRLNGGSLELAGLDPIINDAGVTDVSGLYRPTAKVDADLASLFDIPVKYVRRLRNDHVGLLDTNINEWADRMTTKRVLVRTLFGSDPAHPESSGVVRAILSDRYGVRDNLDTVLAVLNGMREAGLGATNIRSADLSDDKLYLRVEAPEFNVVADKFLEGYRSPFKGSGHGGAAAENPYLVHAGILVTNSETGGGAFSITPELRIRICDNGMTINADAMRKVHLGGRLDEGQIQWSTRTQDAANELTKQQVRDAVSSFLNTEYVQGAVAKLEETSGVEVADPAKTIEVVSKQLSFTEDEAKGILDHFIKGGQVTAGGVAQAVTSYAQVIEDVDRANDFAAKGVDAMLIAAAV